MVKRCDIHIATLNKVEKFLKKQKKPVFMTDIVKKTGVNYDSLKFAMTLISHKINKEGKVYLRKR
jgi:hypothetical protein